MAKGNWTKFHSDAIHQDCAYDKTSGWLFTHVPRGVINRVYNNENKR